MGAVDTQADMPSVVGLVRPLLHSFGIRLPNRVTVQLTGLAELEHRIGNSVLGLTVAEYSVAGSRVTELLVADGLPATQFGKVLAHEMSHAWLAGCPTVAREPQEEEGICELVGSWWLNHRGGKLSTHLLNAMHSNPDPIYGGGFRTAHHLTQGMTPPQVVQRIRMAGCL